MTGGLAQEQPLEDRFRAIAFATASAAGITFSHQSGADLDSVIVAGVQRLQQSGPPTPDDVWRAEQLLGVLVQSMIREAHTQNAAMLHEWSLRAARKLLCPLPPWFPEPCN